MTMILGDMDLKNQENTKKILESLKKIREALKTQNLKTHKIVQLSNNIEHRKFLVFDS